MFLSRIYQPRRPSRVMASMCDTGWPVGMVLVTFNAYGWITVTALTSSAVT